MRLLIYNLDSSAVVCPDPEKNAKLHSQQGLQQ